jgi:Leucine-rich repeat (LRR) protein
LEKLRLNKNKISEIPPEIGELHNLSIIKHGIQLFNTHPDIDKQTKDAKECVILKQQDKVDSK